MGLIEKIIKKKITNVGKELIEEYKDKIIKLKDSVKIFYKERLKELKNIIY